MVCPACSGKRFTQLKKVAIARCTRCGLGTTLTPGPPWGPQPLDPNRPIYLRERAHFLLRKTIAPWFPKPGTVLDVGVKAGELVEVLNEHGWKATGIDVERNANWTGFRSGGIEYHETPWESFQTEKRFDLIIFNHSFEHLLDPNAVLRKCRSLLKEKGKLLIIVPNFGGAWAKLTGEDWEWFNTPEHFFHYTRSALKYLARAEGLSPLKVTTSALGQPSLLSFVVSSKSPFRKWAERSQYPVNRWLDRFQLGGEIWMVATT